MTTLFQSERLLVRQYTTADGDAFFSFNGDAEVMRYIRKAKTREECDLFLEENLVYYNEHPGLGRFAILSKTNGGFVGSFSLLPLENSDEIHVGYGLLTPFHGLGYATEIVKASLTYIFETLHYNKVLAVTMPENIASQKVLFKCGFEQTGTTVHEGDEVLIFEKNGPVE